MSSHKNKVVKCYLRGQSPHALTSADGMLRRYSPNVRSADLISTTNLVLLPPPNSHPFAPQAAYPCRRSGTTREMCKPSCALLIKTSYSRRELSAKLL